MSDQPRRRSPLREALGRSFGANMFDVLAVAGKERQRVLVDSAKWFQSDVDLPGWKPVLSMPIDLGGMSQNDLMLFAYVQLTDIAAWQDLLAAATSIKVDPWRVRVGF